MRTIILAFVTILLLYQGAYSQNILDGVYLRSENEIIADVDVRTQEIRTNLVNYTKIEKFKDDKNDKFVFLHNNELKLVTLKTWDNNIEKRVSWYFSNGRLIFSEQIWIDNNSNSIINHEKLYEDIGHLVAWIKTDNTKENVSSTDFKLVDKELAIYSENLQNEFLK